MKEITAAICERLALIRRQNYGPRGRSRFAEELGIGPSTYSHYESDRLPPADILLRAARLTGTRLEWLITGEGEPAEPSQRPPSGKRPPAVERLHSLLESHPELLPQVEAFLEALARLRSRERGGTKPARRLSRPTADELIPVIGSTSAGTARYWSEVPESREGPVADARLEELLATCTGPTVEAAARFGPAAGEGAVSLIQLSQPDDRGLLEFLSAPAFKGSYPDCVAWRIDGESMSPRYHDGDLVLTSPSHSAETGHPCVARQRGQLGVNCKVYRREEETIWLIPINPEYATQVVPAREVMWAWRVVASVRLQRSGG